MFRSTFPFVLALTAIMAFAAGCASTPGAPAATFVPTVVQAATAVQPTTEPSTPASRSTAAAPKATSQTVSDSSGSIIKLEVVPAKSEARYRVREQLASLSLPSDAIGKTSAITGTIVGKTDGTILSSDSKFVVDLSTLQSDRSQRDNFLRRNVLQTDQYPDATFVPTQATGLPSGFPSSGQASFKLTGNLTIRNVTKPVTWDVSCQGQQTEGLCHATTSFHFEYFDLTQPHVSVVLSIVNNITLEVDIYLRRVGA
jgi:polyisoprenoid-binding protein YceI